MTKTNLGDYQMGIYVQGMFGGQAPAVTTDLVSLEDRAAGVLTPEALGYIRPAAGSGATTAANREAFNQWKIVPRMLNGVAERDHSTVVLGTAMPTPLIMAPLGVQTLAHPDGELASARAAAEVGVTYVHSTQAAHTFEQVAEANGDGTRWYQLYWPSDRDVCESFLERAAASGYTALMLTLDTVVLAWRPHDLDRGYLPFLQGVGIANYLSDPAFRAGLVRSPEDDPAGAVLRFGQIYSNPGLSWPDLAFLREKWDGPIALKGIQSPADARMAVDHGIDGVIVSNHGGRQVDGAIASLDALELVVDEVGGEISVLFDSGIRTGSDMVKALALGADAVMVGRPYIYGLAMNGQAGVEHVLRSLLAEFDLTTVLSGHHSQRDLSRASLTRVRPQ
ncbi:alpha-hydroxy-acid oxidizing protein [Streptomyces sp. NPDC056987]|uniref:alpha-hydroxy-acid oxidizing protein n=1 Tax=Streptomyces sp. NPDC056987 TaxID=3345988 RepID=UPI00362C775E